MVVVLRDSRSNKRRMKVWSPPLVITGALALLGRQHVPVYYVRVFLLDAALRYGHFPARRMISRSPLDSPELSSSEPVFSARLQDRAAPLPAARRVCLSVSLFTLLIILALSHHS